MRTATMVMMAAACSENKLGTIEPETDAEDAEVEDTETGDVASGACTIDLSAQAENTELDATIEAKMEEAHIPGLAACLIQGEEVVWCGAYGLANIEEQVPVTIDTPFLLASVSKLFTATAVMQLQEAGVLELDDDVDDAVSYSIAHPEHADTAISYRSLLAHVGGVADNGQVMNGFYSSGGDPELSLASVIEGYFDPAGQWYDADRNFLSDAPETRSMYSNMGFALLGQLVAEHTGQDFAQYTQDNIFAPLGMSRTSWWLSDFDEGEVAMPYGWRNGELTPYGQYSFADYPNGSLRSSALDVACFLATQANGGVRGGVRILEESTLQGMQQLAYPDLDPYQGLGWYYEYLGESQDWVGHSGGEDGAATDVFMRPGGDLGLVVLMNGDWGMGDPIYEIEDALIAFGDTL